jgi:6-phosphogluconolactonase
VVSGGVLNGQIASCWVTMAPNGMNAYTSNTGSNTVTNYAVDAGGRLTLQQAAVTSGPAPIDSGITADGRTFFQLSGQKSAISMYSVGTNGDLSLVWIRQTALPGIGVQGFAVSR